MTDGNDNSYDYLLKFLLVGDSDVGKDEFLSGLPDGYTEYGHSNGIIFKTKTILLDGKRIKLQLWDTSGQGRFCTIFRSYSRGAQGVLLVYDITNRWSFDGIDRWIKEIHQHAPGIPKILVGNRLHLAFDRQVSEFNAEEYAERNDMKFLEVSPLCDFNITESLSELARVALDRNGINKFWSPDKVLSLQEFCCKSIVRCTTDQQLDELDLPGKLKARIKSYHQPSVPQRYYSMSKVKRTASNLGQSKSTGSALACLSSSKPTQYRCITPRCPPDRKSCTIS